MVVTSEKPPQRFKSIYFPDLKDMRGQRQCLTLAFSADDDELLSKVAGMSSVELRGLIGHRTSEALQRAALKEDRSVNSYCLRRLARRLKDNQMVVPSSGAMSTQDGNIGLLATFRGGAREPLHEWFPYLEGYSPQFVEQMLARYAPQASCVLDPFGGVGTTPLTSARLGLSAVYCELNPLLQQLIASKARVLTLAAADRELLAEKLEHLAESVRKSCRQASPDHLLKITYEMTFGDSQFFDAETFDTVLRLRSVLDQVGIEDRLTAALGEIAAVASLLPASRLIRRGDVRFKTEVESAAGVEDLLEVTARQLQRMATDLRRIESVPIEPVLLCADAKQLGRLPQMKIDAVLTSPPYINGTNYFRNTKVELWFLRSLRSGADLTAFRASAITGGINDVTKGKLKREVPHQARAVVAELERNAYDRRIPAMVANYFADMADVIDGMTVHLTSGAPVMIDIGDSNYGGVQVPAEKILHQMFAERGFRLIEDVTLRKRSSRGGQELRQALLVFEYQGVRASSLREDTPRSPWWNIRWQRFKDELPHQHGVFAKRNWGHGLHSLCSYQGKMKPAIAHFLTRTFVPQGGVILDPFAGVGTIPLEAALQGMSSWSFDISPAALHISQAKLGRVTLAECELLLGQIETFVNKSKVAAGEYATAEQIRFNGPLGGYFAPQTFDEILKTRRYFREHPPVNEAESFVLACLLHILHGNRPYALSRRSHPITPFAPTGEFEYRALIPRLRDKVGRALSSELPPEFTPGRVLHQDACGFWPREVCDLDAIITSPPFFDSTRFYLANWMRLWFCGWEAADFKTKPQGFMDERQKKDLSIYSPIFRQARERLKPGGVLVLHLGESRKCDMAAHLKHVSRHWFRVADCFSESVAHCESHGIRDKGTVTAHQFLVLE
jgi:tRNA G10  N-methylase Trm11